MKVVQINSTCGAGSTGKICVAVSRLLTQAGVENYILYTLGNSSYDKGRKYSDNKYIMLQAAKARIFGNCGFNSKRATRRLIASLESIKPHIIHIHNIHSHDCDLEMLFRYLKTQKVKLFWTFHDCWSFTGYCHYFTMADCSRWENGCGNCPSRSRHSLLIDRSAELFGKKKELFAGLDMTVITPSAWLGELAGRSFFGNYPIKVINNGIDLSVFRPRERDMRAVLGVEDKFLIMGCSFDWDRRKGIDVFASLAQRLGDGFAIVLVGTNEGLDKSLPENIISIHRTADQEELSRIYSAADLFVNPTREENYPTVNMEALACGTPVLTFNTGGSAEILGKDCGLAVERGDVDALEREIRRIEREAPFSREACRAHAESFDMNKRFKEYVDLYLKGEEGEVNE